MKIIENEEFFKLFNENAMSYTQWLDSFEKPESKERTMTHFSQSTFIEEYSKKQLEELHYKQYILAIVADWCGDCHRNVPVFEHICNSSDLLELKFLKKEDHLDLILKSNGSEKIPYVMFYSQDGFYVANWIERSFEAYKLVSKTLQKFHYQKDEEFFKAYRETMASDNDMIHKSTADEIINVILKVNAIQAASGRINVPTVEH